MKRTTQLLGILILVGSCTTEPGATWLSPRLAADVTVDRTAGTGLPLTFWRRGDVALGFRSALAADRVRHTLSASDVVMVSFDFGSSLSLALAGDPLTLVHDQGTESRRGFAMVAVPDPMVRDGLAAAAHASSQHACGNIKSLSLATLATEIKVTPPVYPEVVSLAPVQALLSGASRTNIDASIKTLEALGTRFHTTETGLQTPDKVQELFSQADGGRLAGASFAQVAHDGSSQKSVVMTIPGTTDDATTVVLGAHLDSINSGGTTLDAPGADDDASGIATLVEVVRILAASGATFKRRIELHGYAAEEVGLVGSRALAASYAAAGRKVAGMMQIDMNSWSKEPGTTIHLISTNTSGTLRRSAKDLLNTYLEGGFSEVPLDAGTSDHESWHDLGFPAVFPFENPKAYNKALHSTKDTTATINNLALSERFAKLAVAFLAHHAGLVAAEADAGAAAAGFKSATPRDLKLSLTPSQAEGYFTVGVASPAGLAKIEVCLVGEVGGMGCTVERIAGGTGSVVGERTFYTVTQTVAIAAGTRLAVFGYDAADKLVAQRTVRLDAK